jgi:hypothetical protein
MKEKIKNSEAGQIKLSDILKKGEMPESRIVNSKEEMKIIEDTIKKQKSILTKLKT